MSLIGKIVNNRDSATLNVANTQTITYNTISESNKSATPSKSNDISDLLESLCETQTNSGDHDELTIHVEDGKLSWFNNMYIL